MKALGLFILRLLFIAAYSVVVGLLTGWLWNKFMEHQYSKLGRSARYVQPIAA